MKINLLKKISLFFCSVAFALSFVNLKMNVVHADEDEARYAYYDISGDNAQYIEAIKGKTGNELLNGLSLLMSGTQTYINRYDELVEFNIKTDQDPMNENNFIDIYSRKSYSGDWLNGSSWNREHVWPKNLSNGLFTSVSNSDKNAGTDIHHLRPSIASYNNSRSNTPFGEIERDGKYVLDTENKTGLVQDPQYPEDESKTKTVFEPSDNIKGDIARILMYVYVRYSSSLSSSSGELGARGDLDIKKVLLTSSDTDSASWNILVKWNELDPVDYIEIKRNDEAQLIEGNRNVFIDHPEFARMCFADYSGEGALIDLRNTYDSSRVSYLGMDTYSIQTRVGETIKIEAKTFPENIKENITWSSSDKNIARVSSNGKVVILQDGLVNIVAESKSGLKATCYIDADSAGEIFMYDGSPLHSANKYVDNAQTEYTNNGITMSISASYCYQKNGLLWLGPSSGKQNEAAALISKDSAIGQALDLNSDHRGAVLYFNYDLENVAKVTYQQVKGDCNLESKLRLVYSTDNGETYQAIPQTINLGTNTERLAFEFEPISKASYAIVLLSYNALSGYAQSQGPQVTFYRENLTNAEIIDDLIDGLDLSDEADIIFEGYIIQYIKQFYDSLDDNEKVNVTKINVIKSINEVDNVAYEFALNYLYKLYENPSNEEIVEILTSYDNLPEYVKEAFKRYRNIDSTTYGECNSIDDVINALKKEIGYNPSQDSTQIDSATSVPVNSSSINSTSVDSSFVNSSNPISNSPVSNNQMSNDSTSVDSDDNSYPYVIIGVAVGVLLLTGSIILILKKKK